MRFKVIYNNETFYFHKPITILEIVGQNKDYICCTVNNRLRELTYVIKENAEIKPLTVKNEKAKSTYNSSLRYIAAMVMNQFFPDVEYRFSYNISRSLYLEFKNRNVDEAIVNKFIQELEKIVKSDIPLIRTKFNKDDAPKIFEKYNCIDKASILKYRPEKTCHLYICNDYANYMYNRLVPSTGYVRQYKCFKYQNGIILQYPRHDSDGKIPPFEDSPVFLKTLATAEEQATITGVDTIVAINNLIEEQGEAEIINLGEAYHSRQLAELGDIIEKSKNKIRLIYIAGPSSSGKTTFANRLRIELITRGLRPIRISLDNYYVTHDKTPRDENGNLDFEHINALDIPRFKKDIKDLIDGKTVTLPIFDFKTASIKEGPTYTLKSNQPLIIEGIHALNPLITSVGSNEQNYRIFISPMPNISIDRDNPMALTDLRLLRRIVRDHQKRNVSVKDTIAMWPSVRKGEFTWIYKTQENSDFVFNSFLPYELCALKKYAQPLLMKVTSDNPQFPTVERLIRLLKFFVSINDEWIPTNSLIREFIGHSCYPDV